MPLAPFRPAMLGRRSHSQSTSTPWALHSLYETPPFRIASHSVGRDAPCVLHPRDGPCARPVRHHNLLVGLRWPSAVVKAGHEISTVPVAAVPSARWTVSTICVITGPFDCARASTHAGSCNTAAAINIRKQKNRPIGRHALRIACAFFSVPDHPALLITVRCPRCQQPTAAYLLAAS
jgi:hypothetical protein